MLSANFKKILITGGTGSFGSAFLERLLQSDVEEIRIFSRDEYKQDLMLSKFSDSRINFIIGDIRDEDAISRACVGIDGAFLAAAMKQVPSCEVFPIEAVKTNILGVNNTLRSCVAQNVKSVVVLSTDKAVEPVNAMGQSKALMEKVALAMGRDDVETRINITRYGNVLASRGSVVPRFINEIRHQRPLTVTDLNMTRFLMSLNESVDLVLEALDSNVSGRVFVKKAPAATVQTIIEAISDILSVTPHLNEIGPRPGEKYHETLITGEERAKAQETADYFIVNQTMQSDNDKVWPKHYTSASTKILDVEELVDIFRNNRQIKELLQ
jgi:UDP-N-acetylglucosamine 4,6-dehydratase